jgi:hypothetical protein
MVINCGSITASGTYTFPHGIAVTNNYTFTRIYGTASNAALDASTWAEFIPLPYASVSSINDNVELWVDNVNVNISTGSGVATYPYTYVVLEYIKQ